MNTISHGALAKNGIFRVFYAHFAQATILNILTELDRDMFIENKKVPHDRFIPNIVKNLYRVRASAHARAHKCLFFALYLCYVQAISQLPFHLGC